MEKSEFSELFGRLLSAFPTARRDPEVYDAYWSVLGTVTLDKFANVCWTVMNEDRFLPSSGELLCAALGTLTRERAEEKRRAFERLKRSDSYARESDVEGYEPRRLLNAPTSWSRGERIKLSPSPNVELPVRRP